MKFRLPFRGESRTSFGGPSSLENPSIPLMQALGALDYMHLPGGIAEGNHVSITPRNALTFAAVYSCVRVISESLASLPFHLYEKTANSRLQVEDDPRAYLLNEEPNPEQDAMVFWETALGHCLLWGNAYIHKQTNPSTGLTESLWLLNPSQTRALRLPDNSLAYSTYLPNGKQQFLLPDEIIHVKAFGTGDVGLSPIGAARRAIGIGIAADEYAAHFYRNDATPGGIISTDKQMSEEQFQAFRTRWNASHQGIGRNQLIGILDNGLSWKDVGIPAGDQQFIEQRKWQALDVCRVYRVQPHKAGFVEAGSVSYASVEMFNIDFVVDTIRPWATRIEKAIQRGMFGSEPDRLRKLYPRWQLNGLLRGDMAARSSYYASGISSGWLLKNEVRELEDLPYIDGLDDKPEPPPPPADPNANGNTPIDIQQMLDAMGQPN